MERAERNVRIYMELYPPTSFFISPSYARFMGALIRETKIRFPVSTILGWNEVGYSLPGVRARVEGLWSEVSTEPQVKAFDVYGMMEAGLLGYECQAQNGLHTFEDSYVYEIIDPESERLLDHGEEGELVVTHLDREGMPFIRYRTGDITRIEKEPCGCGRTHARLMGIKGRWSERLSVNGATLYPGDVEEAMILFEGYEGAYHIVINGRREVDFLEIAIDEDRIDSSSKGAIQTHLESHLGVPVILRDVPGAELLVYPHRSHRVIDYSNKGMYRKQHKMQITSEM
jgi:phenylacetate-CoA ligase